MVARLYNAPSVGKPQQQNTVGDTHPAPVRGMNATASLYGRPHDEAVYLYNFVPSEFGVRSRLGYLKWADGMAGDGIRTIVPYDATEFQDTNDRLFAVTNDGIYDCTVQGTAVKEIDFADKSSDAGYGHFTHYVNDNGDDVLVAAFSGNGLFEYDPALDAWAAITDINFPAGDPTTEADIEFVMTHKQRLWLISKDASHAYYLPINSKSGNATRFDFGNKFKYGGELVGLYTWTLDGGDGVDDYLVACGRGGDVIMYRGDDPDSANTWSNTGSWFVGEFPANRRVAIEVGGNLMLISTSGIVSATELVRGVDPDYDQAGIYDPIRKISRFIRDRMATEANEPGWEIIPNARESQIVVNSPPRVGQPKLQYVYSVAMRAWGLWRSVPAKTMESWNGKLYLGGEDTVLYQQEGFLDAVDVEDPASGMEIDFSMLGTFQGFGAASKFKRCHYLRPVFISDIPPTYSVLPKYDYDVAEITLDTGVPAAGAGRWNDGTWDSAIWGGELTAYEALRGGGGLGRVFAYAIRGSVQSRTTFVAIDVMWDQGGLT